jgi:hypothetical protein
MSLQREDCIHPFDNGFLPEISKDRTGIIVTRSSPLISAVSRKRPGEYPSGAVLSLAEEAAERPLPTGGRVSGSESLELGWLDVHRALGKL